ncbi:aldehyde dehydrogenase [Deinococcus phoenicis]|uniref:Aldehyde dehydrogenase n=1 Tax=Deinococcus phoenicis TaxID=1476583 RepID=A0A016QL58_9DEIO|nr:aldehyde dehydrogenase family protein [Deinococcus phoenicis]EYB66895.1 aldehyde dehydrogenase [Deinococcus phoenicis]
MNTAASPTVPSDLRAIFEAQQAHRLRMAQTGAAERQAILRRLRGAIHRHRVRLAEALAADLGKSRAEAEITELHSVVGELNHAVAHLPRWMRPRRVATPATLLGSRSRVVPEARGVTLILSPWNYPVNLSLAPLIASLAAGNTVMLKPSEKAPATAQALRTMLAEVFEPRLVAVIGGGADVAQALTGLPFDHIFFTGSGEIGRRVMEAAARNLTPVTLELGGKSPALVGRSADLGLAAERIGWGKFLNAGQTCVAPDYVLVPEGQHDEFVERLRAVVTRRYGPHPGTLTDFGRMVDAASVDRLQRLTDASVRAGARVVFGGQFDAGQRFISPTLVTGVTPEMPLMREELFGPVLPILPYRDLPDALALVRRLDTPLALYVFTRDPAQAEEVRRETRSGALVVNGTVVHLTNPNLPFGGTGPSGMGSYHGEYGFRAFSHERAVLQEAALSPTHLSFPPYGRPAPRFTAWLLRQMERTLPSG